MFMPRPVGLLTARPSKASSLYVKFCEPRHAICEALAGTRLGRAGAKGGAVDQMDFSEARSSFVPILSEASARQG